MINFEFISNTKMYFGKNEKYRIGKIIKDYGFKNIAMVYGKGSIKRQGLYDIVINSLKENEINFIEIEGVEANPKLSFVKKAINKLKDKNIELILAIGGGSVIDTSKSIACGLHYDGDPFDFNLKKVSVTKATPVGVILTIAAAGSELSSSCVISNDEVTPFIKTGFNSDLIRPLFEISDPTLTYSVSKYQTACGVTDIMMHTLERFMNPIDSCDLSENIAIGLLKTVLKYGPIVINDPTNYEARANIMLASSLTHNGLTGLGKSFNMRVHGLEHILSGFYDEVAHGAGLAILWPAWCKYVLDEPRANKQLTRLSKELFNLDDPLDGINKLQEFFKSIGMPTHLSDLKLSKPLDINSMALAYSKNKTFSLDNFKVIDYQGFINIFNLAK